jgi:H+/Cl- antiporter ClcA
LAKAFTTEYRLELGSLLSLLFGFVTVIGIVGVFLSDRLPASISFLSDLSDPIGNWTYWMIVIGPIGLIAGIWWLYDFFKKVKTLAGLIDTPSKAKFVRNIDDIEYLAWSLPQRYETTVLEKKSGFDL